MGLSYAQPVKSLRQQSDIFPMHVLASGRAAEAGQLVVERWRQRYRKTLGISHSTMTGHSNQVSPLTRGHINDGFDNPPVFDELLDLNAFLAEFATPVNHT